MKPAPMIMLRFSLRFLAAPVAFVHGLVAPASAENWTGAIRCEISVTADGYAHQETQTWTLTGAAPKVEGAYEICDATWSVTGQGWHDRAGQTARRVARWAANVPGSSAPVAFFRPSPGKLIVQLRHGQLSSAEGYAGTDQYLNNHGAAGPERGLVQRLFEWTSWKIEPSPPDTQLTGSQTSKVSAGIAPLHPGDAQVTITMTWALGRGTAPPMPPPTLPPPPAPPDRSNPPTPPGRTSPLPPGPSGPGNDPGSPAADESPADGGGPRLVSLSPRSVEEGVSLSEPITFTGEGTHWQQGTTTVNLGPGIAIPTMRVDSPTSLTTQLTVSYAAEPGPRAVTVTTGDEVVTLADGLYVIEREQPTITQISPDNAPVGTQDFSVVLTGRGTRWIQGTTALMSISGQGVSAASLVTVNSGSSATVRLNIDASAAPGPRELTLLNRGPVAGDDIVRATFTVTDGPAQNPSMLPKITQVTPASAPPGTRALTVSISGSGTHFNNVSWVEFGDLVGATSFTVTSPTSATAVINIDPAAPPGPRTVSVMTPVEGTASIVGETASLPNGFTVGTPATSGRYRVTATRLKVHQEEWDHRTKQHGRNNEIFLSKHAQVIDRRNGAKIAYDVTNLYTPVHGDINNASDYHHELRIRAGSFASSGGIQTGDEIDVWNVDWAEFRPDGMPANPQEGVAERAISTVVLSSKYRPFVLWEGSLSAGAEVVLIRPVVWLGMEVRWYGRDEFRRPYAVRLEDEESSVDFLALPAIRDALNRGDLIARPGELVTSGRWLIDQHRPFGLVVNGNQNGSPAKWTDLVVVLTHEKLREWLSGTSSRNLELRIRSSMTGQNPVPMGDCSLFLKIEKLP